MIRLFTHLRLYYFLQLSMGKNRHSKDRLFITATEWAIEYGGKKNRDRNAGDLARPLPFDHCALSLAPYSIPAVLITKCDAISLLKYYWY